MNRDPMVQWWARWSRNVMKGFIEKNGPGGVAAHDRAQKVIEDGFRFYNVDPAPSGLAGLLLAMSLVQHNAGLPRDVRMEVVAFLRTQAGLAAEVIQSIEAKRRFEEVVSESNRGAVRRASVASKFYSEGGKEMTGIFSCDPAGDVWRPTGKGWTPPAERVSLRGTDIRLDSIVNEVLAVSPGGGRFTIQLEGVYLVRDLRKVA